VVEFGPSSGISFTDLRKFEEGTNTPLQNISYTVGDFEPFSPANGIDGEATLDAQYIIALGSGADTSYWNVNGWIIDLTSLIQQRLSDQVHVPWIFSMSYGWAESQQCVIAGEGSFCAATNASANYVARTNTELQKVGLAGITMVGLSQDAGAASKWNMACNHPNSQVNPSYPGSSPYLVCLGATMLVDVSPLSQDSPPFCQTQVCAGAGQEVVCSTQTGALITSGGGFSNDAPRPSYQDAAVKAWLAGDGLRPPRSDWNANGRAYPDISTLGHQVGELSIA
jgi:tripeptidyl-peptidase I